MSKNIKGTINSRLINEVDNIDTNDNIKGFLKDLLNAENAGIYPSNYYEEYKKLIRSYLDEK